MDIPLSKAIWIQAGKTQKGQATLEERPGIPDSEYVGSTTNVSRKRFYTADGDQAFFNQSTGDDTTGTGTRAAPYKTVTKAWTDVPGTKDIACQLDTGDLDLAIISEPLQADIGIAPNLKFTSTTTFNNESPAGLTSVTIGHYGHDAYHLIASGANMEYATDPTGTWTAGTSNFGSDGILSIHHGKDGYWVLVGQNGKMSTQTDPTGSFTVNTSAGFGSNDINSVYYGNGYWVAVGENGTLRYAIDPTGTWTAGTISTALDLENVKYGGGKWVATDGNTTIFTTTNPTANWSTNGVVTNDSVMVGYQHLEYSPDEDLWLIGFQNSFGGPHAELYWSSNLLNWNQIDISSIVTGEYVISISYGMGRWMFSDLTDGVYYSTTPKDGTSWTKETLSSIVAMTYFGGGYFMVGGSFANYLKSNQWSILVNDKLCGYNITHPFEANGEMLNNTGTDGYLNDGIDLDNNNFTGAIDNTWFTSATNIQYTIIDTTRDLLIKNSNTTTIISSELGNDISFSGQVDFDNVQCEGEANGTSFNDNNIDLDNCLFINKVTGNSVTLTGVASVLADIQLIKSTVVGSIYFANSGGSGNERVRGSIITGNLTADADFTVDEANIQGDIIGATAGTYITSYGPLFADEILYRLSQIVATDDSAGESSFDSPLLELSNYYDPDGTSGSGRDLGAWSYDRSTVSFFYAKTHKFTRPTNGNQIEYTLSGLDDNLQIGDDAETNFFANPDRVIENIDISFGSVRIEDLDFLKYMRTLTNMDVFVSLFPDTQIALPTATVNGNQSNTAELAVTATDFISGGSTITIGDKKYFVSFPIPSTGTTTHLVLDRVLDEAVTNGQSISISYPANLGEFTMKLPPIKYFIGADGQVNWVGGLTLNFVRKNE
ncbi:MAG: hypothetical protein ACXAC7_18430 [Candidatus Hodarchaeales archaeon]|jgi:hypothetical protein